MNSQRLRALVCGAVVAIFASTAFAQPAPKTTASPAAPAPSAPQLPPQPAPEPPPPPTWESFPTMLLEKVYRGPLNDTVIQRWRDPVDGSVCYIYVPISVPRLQQSGPYVQYGAAGIGSISCVHTTEVVQLWQAPPQQPEKPRRP